MTGVRHMDFGTTLKHLAPFIVPILALCIPIAAIFVRHAERINRNNNLHQTIRLLSERGADLPPELLQAAITEPQSPLEPKPWSQAAQLRAGIINVCIGIGLMILFSAMRLDQSVPEWLWVIGAIPLVIGIAFFIIWYIESRNKPL